MRGEGVTGERIGLVSMLACAIAAGCADTSKHEDAGARPAPQRDGAVDAGRRDGGTGDDAGAPRMGPLEAPWEWIEVAGSVCRNGSTAGFHVSRNPGSRELLLYLEGGGACYDAQTCERNPDSSWQLPPSDGLFARGEVLNPVADWSFVYVPYCSGDHYAGDAEDVEVPGVPGVQQFKGRRNMERFLARIVDEFAELDRVLVSGTSAGGIGTLMSYRVMQAAFGATPVTVIDDAGPVLSREHSAPCLAELRRQLWGLDRTILADCGEHCPDPESFTFDYALYNIEAMPRAGGLIVGIDDWILRSFLGIGSNDGANDCKGSLTTTPLDSAAFAAALLDFRERVRARNPRFGTYFPSSPQHGWVVFPFLFTQTAGDEAVSMIDWVRAVLDDEPATHVGP